jgi:hypothetical protein
MQSWEIRYLRRQEIDEQRWNHCIKSSPNGLIYANTFYLDAMADNWDALVLNEYEAAMPLPWRKKGGIRYIYQVPFLQRLGIVGPSVDDTLAHLFHQHAVQHFKFINYKTNVWWQPHAALLARCTNYFVPLSQPYAVIQARFSVECKKNIRKAESRGCLLQMNAPVASITKMFQEAYGSFYPGYQADVYNRLGNLIRQGLAEGFCKTYVVTDVSGEPVFTAALFYDVKRIYYSIGAPTEKGRQMRAAYFFINEILKIYASQSLLFDFEGSDIASVAAFYQKFSPASETYYDVKINHLPWPIRLLKK